MQDPRHGIAIGKRAARGAGTSVIQRKLLPIKVFNEHQIASVDALPGDKCIWVADAETAEFITRACNAHDDLEQACQSAYDYLTKDKTLTEFHRGLKLYAQLRAALDKAKPV